MIRGAPATTEKCPRRRANRSRERNNQASPSVTYRKELVNRVRRGELRAGIYGAFASADPELWVATRVIDGADPYWDTTATVIGPPERIRAMFPNGIPFGWRLFKGKAASRFLRRSMQEEIHYQREQQARKKFGGEN